MIIVNVYKFFNNFWEIFIKKWNNGNFIYMFVLGFLFVVCYWIFGVFIYVYSYILIMFL